MLPKYHWNFPCDIHEENRANRLTQTYKKLEEERKRRDLHDLSTNKKLEIDLVKQGVLGTSTLSFAGS